MRYIAVLLITLFITSCGNQKMRFVRSQKSTREVQMNKQVDENSRSNRMETVTDAVIIPSEHQAKQAVERTNETEEKQENLTAQSDQAIDVELNSIERAQIENSLDTSTEQIDPAIQKAEKKTEDMATLALVLAIGTILLLIVGGLGALLFWEELVFIIFAVVALLMSLGSIVISIMTLRSNSRSPLATRRSIISLVFAGIGLLLTASILLSIL